MATAAPRSAAVPDAGYVILIAAAAAMGGFLFGFDTAVINGAVLALKDEFAASSLGIGLAVSLALLGSAVGAFVAGPLADRIGRTRCMIIASVMFAVSAIGSGLPFGLYDFIGWRIIGGIAVGAASVIAPAYIAECSPAEMRGRLGSLQQLAIVVGIFVALLSNYAIAGIAGSASAPFWFGFEAWRWMFWSEVPAAVIYGFFAFVIPESPRYLVAQGRNDDAHEVLLRIVGERAPHRVEEIQRTVSAAHKPKLSDLRGRFGLLPIVWIGMGLSMFQQFVGINVIFYYSSDAVADRRLHRAERPADHDDHRPDQHRHHPRRDRLHRQVRPQAAAAGRLHRHGRDARHDGLDLRHLAGQRRGLPGAGRNAGTIALVAANLYVFCFGFSWGPVTWVLLGEMFNNRIRGSALALGAGVQWIANFAVSTTFPPIAFNLGVGAAYGLYTIFAALSFIFVASLHQRDQGQGTGGHEIARGAEPHRRRGPRLGGPGNRAGAAYPGPFVRERPKCHSARTQMRFFRRPASSAGPRYSRSKASAIGHRPSSASTLSAATGAGSPSSPAMPSHAAKKGDKAVIGNSAYRRYLRRVHNEEGARRPGLRDRRRQARRRSPLRRICYPFRWRLRVTLLASVLARTQLRQLPSSSARRRQRRWISRPARGHS